MKARGEGWKEKRRRRQNVSETKKAKRKWTMEKNLKLVINVKGKLLLYHNNLRPLSFISYTPVNTAAASASSATAAQ